MQSEIDTIINWCEKIKQIKNKICIVERNPFNDKIKWTQSKVFIEIDRPMGVSNRASLVYDSRTKQLWHYIGRSWRRVVVDVN